MSLIGSLLSLAIIPLRAKVKERPKEVDNLAVMALADEVRRLTFALNFWREKVYALMDENERLRQDLQSARNDRDLVRAELRELMVQKDPASPYYRHGGFAQAQHQSYQGFGQLQQARYEQLAWGDCTCVPARAQAFGNENTRRQEG